VIDVDKVDEFMSVEELVDREQWDDRYPDHLIPMRVVGILSDFNRRIFQKAHKMTMIETSHLDPKTPEELHRDSEIRDRLMLKHLRELGVEPKYIEQLEWVDMSTINWQRRKTRHASK